MLDVELPKGLEDRLVLYAKKVNQSPEEIVEQALKAYLDQLRAKGIFEDMS